MAPTELAIDFFQDFFQVNISGRTQTVDSRMTRQVVDHCAIHASSLSLSDCWEIGKKHSGHQISRQREKKLVNFVVFVLNLNLCSMLQKYFYRRTLHFVTISWSVRTSLTNTDEEHQTLHPKAHIFHNLCHTHTYTHTYTHTHK